MKLRIAAIALVLAPALAPSLAMACERHKQDQAMSCAEGTVYDSATGACVPQASS